MRDALLKFIDPRFLIAVILVVFFGWAYGENPKDATLIGAMISGFNLAAGYYLGSSRTADNMANANNAAIIAANTPAPPEPRVLLQPPVAGQ